MCDLTAWKRSGLIARKGWKQSETMGIIFFVNSLVCLIAGFIDWVVSKAFN
jgi:hypothetical protein